jgi:DNA-binding MarR family transcriptional regulator
MALVLFSIIILIILSIHQYLYYLLITPNRLKFKNYKINLSDEEYLILQKFISNQHIIENNTLQKILDKDQYDRSHNIRLKNKFIIELNSKLQYLFNNNITNYIQIQKSSFDKRYKRYYLNLENKKLIDKAKQDHRRFTYLLILSIIFLVLWIELELSVFKTLFNIS